MMRRVHRILMGLLGAALGVQIYLAGVGAFGGEDSSFGPHRINGMVVIPALILLGIGAAALARLPGRVIGLTALPLGLLVVQVLIGVIAHAFDTGTGEPSTVGMLFFGLHALNAFAIMATADKAQREARKVTAPEVASSAA